MNTARLRFCFVLAIVAASLILPLALWGHARSISLQQGQRLSALVKQITALDNENQRLSNTLGQVNEPDSANLAELLKLRGQIGLLRQNLVEATNLVTRNKRLAMAVANLPPTQNPAALPEGQTVLVHWQRDQLGFAGYASPAAALESTLWAMAQADTNTLVNSVTPEIRSKMLREEWYQHGTSAEELAASAHSIADSLQPANGFSVLGQRPVPPDQVVLEVFFDGEGHTRKFAMKQVGAEWKFNALGLAGAPDWDVHPGFSAWP
jgi:hypothetical protein